MSNSGLLCFIAITQMCHRCIWRLEKEKKKERKMDIETETATVTVTCLEWCIFWSVCNAQQTAYCALPSAIIPLDVDNKHKSASRTHEEQTTSPHHGICWAFVATHQTDALTDLWSLLPSNSLINEYIYPHSSLFNKRVIASACLTACLVLENLFRTFARKTIIVATDDAFDVCVQRRITSNIIDEAVPQPRRRPSYTHKSNQAQREEIQLPFASLAETKKKKYKARLRHDCNHRRDSWQAPVDWSADVEWWPLCLFINTSHNGRLYLWLLLLLPLLAVGGWARSVNAKMALPGHIFCLLSSTPIGSATLIYQYLEFCCCCCCSNRIQCWQRTRVTVILSQVREFSEWNCA